MKKVLIALAFLPFAAGVASASEALTDQQMDQVTAGKAFVGGTAFAGGGAALAYAAAYAVGRNAVTGTFTVTDVVGPVSFAFEYGLALSW